MSGWVHSDVHDPVWQRVLKRFRGAATAPGLWRSVLLFAGTNAAATVASSFFTSYTLKSLHLDEQHYVMLNIASTVARFVVSPVWGVVVDTRGARFSSALSIALMIPLPLVLLLSRQSFATAITFQLLAGVFGAGYDTSRLPVLLALATKDNLTTAIVQLYNLANGVACFLASCLSVYFVAYYGSAFDHAPMVCFALSFLLRLIVFLLWLSLEHCSPGTPPPQAAQPQHQPQQPQQQQQQQQQSTTTSTATAPASSILGVHEVWPLASPSRVITRIVRRPNAARRPRKKNKKPRGP